MTADFQINGAARGANLATKFSARSDGVWELAIAPPIRMLAEGTLRLHVRDNQGNQTEIARTFSVP